MGLRELYDSIANLQEILRIELNIGVDLVNQPADSRHIKALAATYELQEYLAHRIAAEVDAGLMDPALKDEKK